MSTPPPLPDPPAEPTSKPPSAPASPSISLKRPRDETNVPATLYLGDTVQYAKSLPAETFDLVVADPPYSDVLKNVAWDSPLRNDRKFTNDWLRAVCRLLRPGGSILVYGSPERLLIHRICLLLADELKMEHKQTLCWTYSQGGGARVSTMNKYAVQHEIVLWFTKPAGKHVFNAARGTERYTEEEREIAKKKGKGRVTDVSLDRGRPPRSYLEFARENSKAKDRQYCRHPSMKPTGLTDHLLKIHGNPGNRVYVPFSGSGTELLCAAKLNMIAFGAEENEQYVSGTQARFEAHNTAITVTHPV